MRPADLTGPCASAWRSPLNDAGAGCGAWVLHAPSSHPFWPWHTLAAVHLRAVEGLPAPHLQFPGASHEVTVVALDPDHYPPSVEGRLKYLMPPDVVEQVLGLDDAQARELLDLLARAVCDGHLVPDSDHRAIWAGTISLGAEHMRLGGHPR